MSRTQVLDPVQRAFVAGARRAVLATRAADDRPRLVPICFVLGEDDRAGRPRLYSAIDEKPKRSTDPYRLARIRDFLILPEATLLVDRWDEDWTRLGWIRLVGTGEILEPQPHERPEHQAAVDLLRAKYAQYVNHALEERPIIRITIRESVSWGAME